jgi:hypothetical protein
MHSQKGLLLITVLLASICYASEGTISLETLAAKSDRIVRGKVRSFSCKASTNEFGDELIYTDVYIGVGEVLKGEKSDLVLTVEGGTVKGVTLTVSDSPEFKAGEEVLVFARRDLLTYRPVAGSWSKYTISDGNRVVEAGTYYSVLKNRILLALRNKGGMK